MCLNSILISGLPGVGRTAIAKHLSEVLNWEFYSIGVFLREEYQKIHDLDPEHALPFEEWWSHKHRREENERLEAEAREKIARGNIVATIKYPLPEIYPDSLRVFLTAPEDTRVAWHSEGRDPEEVRSELRNRGAFESLVGKEMYGFRSPRGKNYDYEDPNNYHMVLSTEENRKEDIERIIIARLNDY
tara:strand:- start:1338 stop:1901 length:564 start_codon:yes stop_codon:yes gene_type:complete